MRPDGCDGDDCHRTPTGTWRHMPGCTSYRTPQEDLRWPDVPDTPAEYWDARAPRTRNTTRKATT